MIQDLEKIDWQKMDNLIPAIVQHYQSKQVLMLGYMNSEALQKTIETKTVYFFSRSKQRLWQKGETSGNFLNLIDIHLDCDGDTFLVLADPVGVTCHFGTETCFANDQKNTLNFLVELEQLITNRINNPDKNSYISKLLSQGKKRIAQKVGEEGVEVALASMLDDKQELIAEAADLLFHLLILLKNHNLSLSDVTNELLRRKN